MSNVTDFHLESLQRRYQHSEYKLASRVEPAAAKVLARLSSEHTSSMTAIAARTAYTQSRRPLLAPLESVSEITNLRPAAAGTPPLTLFRPADAKANEQLPGLIFLHGGGWVLGDLATYEPLVRSLANKTRSVVIWVHYRLAPENPFPAGLEDAWRAASWVYNNATWLNIDSRRIGIGGDSAGGNLAAVTALGARYGRMSFEPAYQLLLYPCLDLTASMASHDLFADGYLLTSKRYAWYRALYLRGANPADWRASPLFASSFTDVAPAIILYAGFDPLRDEALAYAKRLKGVDVPVQILFFPGQIHGFLNMGGVIPAAFTALERIGKAVTSILTAKS